MKKLATWGKEAPNGTSIFCPIRNQRGAKYGISAAGLVGFQWYEGRTPYASHTELALPGSKEVRDLALALSQIEKVIDEIDSATIGNGGKAWDKVVGSVLTARAIINELLTF